MKGTYEKDSDVILFAKSSLGSFLDCLGGAGCTGNDVCTVNLSSRLASQLGVHTIERILRVRLVALLDGAVLVQCNRLNLAILDGDINNQAVRIKVFVCIWIYGNCLCYGLFRRLCCQLVLVPS